MLDDGFFLYSRIHAHDDDPQSAESCRASLQTLVEGCQKQIHPPQKMLFFFNCVLLLNRSRAHPCTYTHFFLFLFFPPSFLSYIIYLFVHHFRSDFKQSVKHVALHFISVTKSLVTDATVRKNAKPRPSSRSFTAQTSRLPRLMQLYY